MQSDGQFGYRMYRNTATHDTVTLAIVRPWRDIWKLYEMAIAHGIDAYVVCHWMVPEALGMISSELTEVTQ